MKENVHNTSRTVSTDSKSTPAQCLREDLRSGRSVQIPHTLAVRLDHARKQFSMGSAGEMLRVLLDYALRDVEAHNVTIVYPPGQMERNS